MKKKHIIKFISLFIFIAVLISTFSLPTFAEAGLSEAVRDEEYTFWDDLAFLGFAVLGAILSPIIVVVKGVEAITMSYKGDN
jgi:O-antigen/teichoic acid export membrane protein